MPLNYPNRTSNRMGSPSTNGSTKKKKYDLLNDMVDGVNVPKLTASALKIWLVLYQKVHSSRCDRIMSRDELMRLTGLSNRSIASGVQELKDAGMLTYERGYNSHGPRKYILKMKKDR